MQAANYFVEPDGVVAETGVEAAARAFEIAEVKRSASGADGVARGVPGMLGTGVRALLVERPTKRVFSGRSENDISDE
jgi:hypothetical protein